MLPEGGLGAELLLCSSSIKIPEKDSGGALREAGAATKDSALALAACAAALAAAAAFSAISLSSRKISLSDVTTGFEGAKGAGLTILGLSGTTAPEGTRGSARRARNEDGGLKSSARAPLDALASAKKLMGECRGEDSPPDVAADALGVSRGRGSLQGDCGLDMTDVGDEISIIDADFRMGEKGFFSMTMSLTSRVGEDALSATPEVKVAGAFGSLACGEEGGAWSCWAPTMAFSALPPSARSAKAVFMSASGWAPLTPAV